MQHPMWRHGVAWLAAVLTTAVVGALVQTQFNLAALQALGATIPFALRLQTSAADVLGFGPFYALVTAVAFALAFPLAAFLARRWPALHAMWFALGGTTSLFVAIRLIDALTPPPVLIAATRSPLGLFTMCACGALGGWVHARLRRLPAPD